MVRLVLHTRRLGHLPDSTARRRKRTQKKNPTWEGDGILLLRGDKAELTDIDTGKRCVPQLSTCCCCVSSR